MFVAAATGCFLDSPLDEAVKRLVDLEYTSVEVLISESGPHLKPSEVLADFDRAVAICRQPRRMTPVAYFVEIEAPEDQYYRQFVACCKLAKATKVVTVAVRASELGTPFNAEIERLRAMVAIASVEGVRVGLVTEVGRMTQDPATAAVLCDNVKGLGLTLDPSHYTYGPTRTCRLSLFVSRRRT